MKKFKKHFLNLLLILIAVITAKAQPFIHPGILHSNQDLERMKKAVANKEQPTYSGYQLFIQNPASQFTYKMQGPLAMVGRNPTVGQTSYDNDANAAHQNTVMWAITGDKRYADKAIEIVNAWSSTLNSITGRDAVLMAGLGPFKMVNAAEILRYTNSGWKQQDITRAEKHFKEVIYPVLKDFAPFANGNWDAAAMKTMMAIAVFCNDRPMFERALYYYVNGEGNGRLTNYVINEEGQIQESGRDQAHTQLGIGLLAECCAIAWNQGLDLYSYHNNRLLKGFEYVAKFNLGYDVPFTEWLDRTGKYHHTKISQIDRGNLRSVYEQVYNHYVNQIGLTAPFSQKAAEKLRPEGPGKPGADHPGYGTLYFSIHKAFKMLSAPPVAPAGIIATPLPGGIQLTWIPSIGADTYTVKRSTKKEGPFTIISQNIGQSNFLDKQVKKGTLYYYTIHAFNTHGESGNASPTSMIAALPYPWKQQDIGLSSPRGKSSFNPGTITIEGSGMGLDSTKDATHFTWQLLNGNFVITVRFVPQPSSQFSKMGLLIRNTLKDTSPFVSLMINPDKTEQIEAPDWHVRLSSRSAAGEKTYINEVGPSLTEPAISWGRLTGYVWLRLQRVGNIFLSKISYDGNKWINVGETTLPLHKIIFAGLAVSSGIPNSTTAFFDNLSISQNN